MRERDGTRRSTAKTKRQDSCKVAQLRRGRDKERLIELARAAMREPGNPRGSGIEGWLGDALFACALSRVDREVDVDYWLSRAIRKCGMRSAGGSLHRGLAGLGLLIAMYTESNNRLREVDEALFTLLAQLPPASMQSGVAGVALYASLRSKATTGRRLQRAVVRALAAAASPSDGGLIWHTPAEYARLRGVDVLGEPVTEFGMVHGIAGTLVGLSALATQGSREAANLARAGLRAAWKRERPGPNRFGRMEFGPHGSKGTLEFSDRRWCVGDPGILRGFWLTATTIGDRALADRALIALRENAVRDAKGALPGAPGRIDLCCGLAVIAQVHRRMYQATGEQLFLVASERLLNRCAQKVEGRGNWSSAYGQKGVLLALLAAHEDEDPVWDAMLGISLPRSVCELETGTHSQRRSSHTPRR